jgi:hypothetical protein
MEWAVTQEILSRTVFFGMGYDMPEKQMESIIRAIRAGADAAL